jgi:hypothetical protein
MSNQIKEPPLWWRIYICFKNFKNFKKWRHRMAIQKAAKMLGKASNYIYNFDDHNKILDIRWELIELLNQLWDEEYKKYKQ